MIAAKKLNGVASPSAKSACASAMPAVDTMPPASIIRFMPIACA